ncbi:MAG: hypothetical protein ABI459_02380 [Deltaproteobacteria bacterium]
MRLIRIYLVAFVVLTIFYGLLRVYSRSLRREKLEKHWDREKPDGTDRETYVQEGLKAYDRSIRPKLFALIYVVPFIVIGVTIYMVNY